MAQVQFDAVFRDLVPVRTASVPASSLGDLVDRLEARYPALRFRIRDETGEVRRYIRVFVNGTEVPKGSGLSAKLAPDDKVDLLHSIQGG
jgi:sulfur-carrier protein